MLQIIIIIVAAAADILTKYLITSPMSVGETYPVFGNWFNITYVKNTGASFGILQDNVGLFIVVTSIVLAAAIVFMIRTRKKQSLFLKISLSLVVGGAIGNFYDRIVFGFVRDFLDFRLPFWRWVFNIADACLVVGAIMLGIYVLFLHKEKDGKTLLAKRDKNKAQENIAEKNEEENIDAK